MRHRAKGRQLSRTSSHRRALLNNMATSLFEHGRVDHDRGQGQGAPAVRREAHHPGAPGRPARAPAGGAQDQDRETLSRLFSEIGPRFAARPGGYTRILKLGHREGDGADIARIELLSE